MHEGLRSFHVAHSVGGWKFEQCVIFKLLIGVRGPLIKTSFIVSLHAIKVRYASCLSDTLGQG